MTGTAKVTVDTTEAQEDLAQLEQQASVINAQVVRAVRRSYQSLALMLDIFGIAIPTVIQTLASAVFLAAETYMELAAAETITVVGAAKAILTFTMAGLLFYRALSLQEEGRQAENTLNSLIQLHGVWY